MKLIKIDGDVPKSDPSFDRKHKYFKMKPYFDEFIAMNTKVARIDLAEGDYMSFSAAINSLRSAAKRYVVPVKVITSEGLIYLVRKDM